MITINLNLTVKSLLPKLKKVFEISGEKINLLQKSWNPGSGSPVFTIDGVYTSQKWTDWTQGFQFGSCILQYDATDEISFLHVGREGIINYMTPHLTNFGVHDHGFNNISTYGNLLRLILDGRIPYNLWEKNFYELSLKVSGAVQAARWTEINSEEGFIYSFNGPHSLFADTIRSLRSLAVAHQLGESLITENDLRISLLDRLIIHALTTSKYNVYFGEGRDIYDVRGRVAHESIFNSTDGSYRNPSTQQGYSPFSTWTRGLAWILCGYAEELEFFETVKENSFERFDGKAKVMKIFSDTAEAVADFYINNSPTDGIPYWDIGAPGLLKMGDYLNRPSDPFNDFEPVDSSAAVIAAQGFVRLGKFLIDRKYIDEGKKYFQTGLTIADNIFSEPYLSIDSNHQGLVLHSVYHRPRGWDNIPKDKKNPSGEATMWGDYHARELALLLLRMAEDKSYYTFFFTPFKK